MLNAFREMSSEAGWNETSQINVLMDFLDSLVRDGKITTDDFLDFVDKKVADEKSMTDLDMDEEVKRRCQRIVEKHKDIMDPSCTVILDELYEENLDHWNDGRKNHVFTGVKMEFKCDLRDAVKICQLLFDGEDR